jgi:hypothetical protein
MGVTMMGGLLTWLFVVQALLIGALLLGVNYYIWQSMARIKGGERYQTHYQFLVGALTLALFIWLTPHTVLMSAGEVKAMGGAQHPVVGNYGVMSAKNGAVNVMILITALSYLYYRRANRTMTTSWVRTGNLVIGTLFAVGLLNVIWLSVYGFYLPAKVRVGLSAPQAVTSLTVIVVSLLINRAMLKGSIVHGPVQWGKIPVRFSGGLYVGHGSDGVHSLLGAVVLARERVDGRCLTVGLYARARFRREDGHTQHDRVLECRPGVVLDVSAGAATGVERRMGRGVVANIGLGSSSGNLRCQKGTWRA